MQLVVEKRIELLLESYVLGYNDRLRDSKEEK